MKKRLLIIIGVVLIVLIGIVVALPFFIDANQFKPRLETELTTALGREVHMGSVRLAILSGGVTVDNVSICDDPAFSRSPFLKAKQLTVGVALLPLMFSKRLDVRSFTATEPEVSLLRAPSGAWNFSSLGATSKTKTQSEDSRSTESFSVGKLRISNGTIIVGTPGTGGRVQTYENANLSAFDISDSTQFPFQLTAQTPGGGNLKVAGKAGPIDHVDTSLTPLHATIAVQHLDLASTGFVTPSSGLEGLLDFGATLASDGLQLSATGSVKADKVKLVPSGAPSQVTVNIDYDTGYDLRRSTGVLRSGDVHIGKALAQLTGTYSTAGTVTTVQMKLSSNGMSVTDLEGVLPAVGVTLPTGATLQGGTLNADLAISGPVDKLTIAGPVNLSNSRLAGFDLKSRLGALASFAGLGSHAGSDTEIQTLSADLRANPEGTHADNLNLVVPTIGTLVGYGNVGSNGQLDGRMIATLGGASRPIGALASGISLLGGGKSQGGGIPIKIQGTTSHPIFVPDVAGALNNMMKGHGSNTGNAGSRARAAHGLLGGLATKKKKSP
jgi:AsmA protein